MFKYITSLLCLFLLSGCNSDLALKPLDPYHVEVSLNEHSDIQHLKKNDFLWLEADVDCYDNIVLKNSIKAEPKYYFAPTIEIPAETSLIKSFANKYYDYYTMAYHPSFLELAGPVVHIRAIGIKVSKNDEEMKVFALDDQRFEYEYSITTGSLVVKPGPKAIAPKKSGTHYGLRYLGIHNQTIVFEKFKHEVTISQGWVFDSSSISSLSACITISLDEKSFVFENKVIEILQADENFLTMKVSDHHPAL